MMQQISFGQLLRFGLAGAVFLGALLVGFIEPRAMLLQQSGLSAGMVLLAAGLTIGSMLYAVHRAIPFPILDLAFAKLLHREGTLVDLAMIRWTNLRNPDSLQHSMADWGGQVHFLYCSTWAGVAAIATGQLAGWTHSGSVNAINWAIVLLFISAVVYHALYEIYEIRVFAEDAARSL